MEAAQVFLQCGFELFLFVCESGFAGVIILFDGLKIVEGIRGLFLELGDC